MAQTACSRLDPLPKFLPATSTFPEYSGLLSTKSVFFSPAFVYLQSRKRLSPKPCLEVALKNLAGIIWSVSTFSNGNGTHVDSSISNLTFGIIVYFLTSVMNSLGSVILPVMAAAAAVNGLARRVLDPGPCLPSKFLLEVETAYFPTGILSSFIARHDEHPGCRTSNPASWYSFIKPSANICCSTFFEPGTINAVTLADFFLPFMIWAKALKSSILPFVQLPIKT